MLKIKSLKDTKTNKFQGGSDVMTIKKSSAAKAVKEATAQAAADALESAQFIDQLMLEHAELTAKVKDLEWKLMDRTETAEALYELAEHHGVDVGIYAELVYDGGVYVDAPTQGGTWQ